MDRRVISTPPGITWAAPEVANRITWHESGSKRGSRKSLSALKSDDGNNQQREKHRQRRRDSSELSSPREKLQENANSEDVMQNDEASSFALQKRRRPSLQSRRSVRENDPPNAIDEVWNTRNISNFLVRENNEYKLYDRNRINAKYSLHFQKEIAGEEVKKRVGYYKGKQIVPNYVDNIIAKLPYSAFIIDNFMDKRSFNETVQEVVVNDLQDQHKSNTGNVINSENNNNIDNIEGNDANSNYISDKTKYFSKIIGNYKDPSTNYSKIVSTENNNNNNVRTKKLIKRSSELEGRKKDTSKSLAKNKLNKVSTDITHQIPIAAHIQSTAPIPAAVAASIQSTAPIPAAEGIGTQQKKSKISPKKLNKKMIYNNKIIPRSRVESKVPNDTKPRRQVKRGELRLQRVHLSDAAEYRCRVDMQASPTRNARVVLHVIGEL